MNIWKKGRFKSVPAFLIALLFFASTSFAAEDFFLYGNQGAENITTISLIEAGGGETDPDIFSWFTAVDYFRTGPYKGRMISATGSKVYMQSATDPEQWTEIGTVNMTMDPAFIKVSPDGTKIALGTGYGRPIFILPSSVCENTSPEEFYREDEGGYVLGTGVTMHNVNYYDAAWAPDNTTLVINGGQWHGSGGPFGSCVISLNTETGVMAGLITNIPGASASIAVDQNFNLVTGLGYLTAPTNRTGELKVWTSSEWWNDGATAMGRYEDQQRVLANNVLSSAYLGFDPDGNLCVGGGDAFGTGGPTENGYAAIIRHNVVERVVAAAPAGTAAPVDETNAAEYRKFAPDACQNDSATGIIAFDGGISVSWNPTNVSYQTGQHDCTPGSAVDYWEDGITASLTTYRIDEARDSDGDGHMDYLDHSPNTPDTTNIDADGDGYGNIIDGDYNNDGIINTIDHGMFVQNSGTYDAKYDMNSDEMINMIDFAMFTELWGRNNTAPFYNLSL